MTEPLSFSQQAMGDPFSSIWNLWPAEGKRRTDGQKASGRKPHMTPKDRCRSLFSQAQENASTALILAAAKSYVENTEPQYVMGLHRWLEQARWENEDAASGAADRLEPGPDVYDDWRKASGQVKMMLEAMHDQGCPEDVLCCLFSDGIGVTHVNRAKGMPPTPVIRTSYGMNLYYRAASGYAERAGYTRIAYAPSYVEFARDRRAQEQQP